MADTTNNGTAGNNATMPLIPEELERKYGIRNPAPWVCAGPAQGGDGWTR
jgi:hypothetical protein